MTRPRLALAALALAALCPAAAARPRSPLVSSPALTSARAEDSTPATIAIGSKNFPESHLLGELMALVIEAHTDLAVEHTSGLGGTRVCFEALRSGGIDLYPEYTGTAWSVLLHEEERAPGAMETFLRVRSESRRRFDVEWLDPFGPNNTYALAMRADRAATLGIRTLSQLAARAGELKAGFSFEFVERADGYPGLRETYGLEFASLQGIEHSLAYEAVDQGTLDVLDAYSTDGKLARYELRVLVDDAGFFPPYHGAPVVRGATLRAHPELEEALARLAFRLDDERMAALNARVEIAGEGFTEVARDWLTSEGLLEGGRANRPRDATYRGRDGFWTFFVRRRPETLRLVGQHLWLSGLSVLFACLVALPLGIALSRSPLGRRLALGFAGVLQTVPSLALLAFLIAAPGMGLSARSAVTALTLYALLPILRNTISGLGDVDADVLDAARGIGLTERQTLLRVRLPLATRPIMAGVRTAAVLTVGFATLAAFIGAGGLGEPILTGLYLNDTRLILAGALPAAVLALLVDAALGGLEHVLTPRGLREE